MPPEVNKLNLNKRHIQRQFDRSAARYDQVAEMQKIIANELLEFAQLNQQCGVVLDAGCGTGYGLQSLMNAYPDANLTGLDLAPRMLQMAQKNHPCATFQQGDIEELPFNDQVFDLTWSSSAIQWCNTDNAIAELVRVTRPGGSVLLSTFTHGTLKSWRELWSLNEERRFDSVQRIESAFEGAGISDLRFKTKTYTQSFDSFKCAIKSIRDLGAGNAEENRSRGLFGVDQYKAISAKVDNIIGLHGQLELPYCVAFVEAKKI